MKTEENNSLDTLKKLGYEVGIDLLGQKLAWMRFLRGLQNTVFFLLGGLLMSLVNTLFG